MKTCLTEAELLEIAETEASTSAIAHLARCRRCARETELLRADVLVIKRLRRALPESKQFVDQVRRALRK
jgi:hypothetical protein